MIYNDTEGGGGHETITVELKCLTCRTRRDIELRRDVDYDYPMIFRCYCCMDDEPHRPA